MSRTHSNVGSESKVNKSQTSTANHILLPKINGTLMHYKKN